MRYQKFEQIRDQVVDPQTGEVLERRRDHMTSFRRGVTEDNFVKLYYDVYLATIGAGENALTPLLVELAKRMTYSDEGQIVILIKQVREQIAAALAVSDSYIKKQVAKLCDLGVLAHVGRATYQVSPFVLAKGDWDQIQALQLTYDARLHKLGVDAPRPKYLAEAHKKGYQPTTDDSTPTLEGPEVTKRTPPDPEKLALEAEVAALKAQNAELKKAAESGQIPGQVSFFDAQKPENPEK